MKILVNEKISPHKFKTPEGYLVCVDSVLARTGKQTYRRNEIFRDSDDDSEMEVDRLPEEVFSDKTLASFENKPLTLEHPDEDVNSENFKDYAVGFVRDIKRGTDNGQDVILGTLVIQDQDVIDQIENGEYTDLSCGYDCDIDDSDHPQQRNIRGNHVALCEQGRAGNARIVDSNKIIDTTLDEFKKLIDKARQWDISNKLHQEYYDEDDKNLISISEVKQRSSSWPSIQIEYNNKVIVHEEGPENLQDMKNWLNKMLDKALNKVKTIKDSKIKYKGFEIVSNDSTRETSYNVYNSNGTNMNAYLNSDTDLNEIKQQIDDGYLDEYIRDSIKDDNEKRLPRSIKNDIKKYISMMSTRHNRDMNIEDVIRPLEGHGYNMIRQDIKGWYKTGDGMQRKDYFYKVDGYSDTLMISLYADPNSWTVNEINGYFTDSIKDADFHKSGKLEPIGQDVIDFAKRELQKYWTIRDQGKTWTGRIHFQIISKNVINSKSDVDKLIKNLDNLDNILGKKYGATMTFNVGYDFGRNSEAGVDIDNEVWVNDSINDSSDYVEELRRIARKNGKYLSKEDAEQLIDENYNSTKQTIEEFYKELDFNEGGNMKDSINDSLSIKLNKKKNDYDEYVVKVYKNGKYDEAGTYYTDDWDDAVGTLNQMARQNGLRVTQKSNSIYVADSKVKDSKLYYDAPDEKDEDGFSVGYLENVVRRYGLQLRKTNNFVKSGPNKGNREVEIIGDKQKLLKFINKELDGDDMFIESIEDSIKDASYGATTVKIKNASEVSITNLVSKLKSIISGYGSDELRSAKILSLSKSKWDPEIEVKLSIEVYNRRDETTGGDISIDYKINGFESDDDIQVKKMVNEIYKKLSPYKGKEIYRNKSKSYDSKMMDMAMKAIDAIQKLESSKKVKDGYDTEVIEIRNFSEVTLNGLINKVKKETLISSYELRSVKIVSVSKIKYALDEAIKVNLALEIYNKRTGKTDPSTIPIVYDLVDSTKHDNELEISKLRSQVYKKLSSYTGKEIYRNKSKSYDSKKVKDSQASEIVKELKSRFPGIKFQNMRSDKSGAKLVIKDFGNNKKDSVYDYCKNVLEKKYNLITSANYKTGSGDYIILQIYQDNY